MENYFKLQYSRLQRKLIEWGINPILGILIALILFLILSWFLFIKTDYAAWIYIMAAMSYLIKLNSKDRTEPIKAIFNRVKTSLKPSVMPEHSIYTTLNALKPLTLFY